MSDEVINPNVAVSQFFQEFLQPVPRRQEPDYGPFSLETSGPLQVVHHGVAQAPLDPELAVRLVLNVARDGPGANLHRRDSDASQPLDEVVDLLVIHPAP